MLKNREKNMKKSEKEILIPKKQCERKSDKREM